MHEIEMKVKPLCDMKESLMKACESACGQGLAQIDAHELGEVVDMIKDFAEAEKYCWEAVYFKTVIEAMKEGDGEGSMGYNMNRSASTGRYTSGRRGFRPMPAPMGDMMTPEMMERHGIYMGYDDGVMGYSSGGRDGNSGGSYRYGNGGRMGMMDPEGWDPRHSQAYNEYRMSRKHYTETKSPEEKKEMDRHANEHVMDTIATIRDMWRDADPELKKKMKSDFENLLKEMTV